MDKLRKFKLHKINNNQCKGCFENFGLENEVLNRNNNIEKNIYGSYWKTEKNFKLLHFNIDGVLDVYEYFSHDHDAFSSFVKGSNIHINEGYLHKTGLFKIDNDILFGSYSSPLSTGMQHYTKLEGYINGNKLTCVLSYPERVSFKIKINSKGSKCFLYNKTDGFL